MTTIVRPICLGCEHFREQRVGLRCVAFPRGIPDAIVRSQADHRKPYEGDNGIRFEARAPGDAEYARRLFRK